MNLIKSFPSGSFYCSGRIQNTKKIISKNIIADHKFHEGRVIMGKSFRVGRKGLRCMKIRNAGSAMRQI